MKIGDEKVLKLKFPEDYVDNLKGKDVEFTVKVLGIKKRILPELNESFYKDLGYDDIKDEKAFKEEVKNHLLEHKKADSENKYIDELLKKAADNLTVEINPEIVEDEVNRMINQYREQLKMQGLSLEQYLAFTKSDMESLKKMMEPEALNRIKSRYLLEAIADKEKITVTDDETKEEANKMAEHYNVTVEELINMIGGEDVVAYDLKMRKAIEVLKNN
jgi:trigger factor